MHSNYLSFALALTLCVYVTFTKGSWKQQIRRKFKNLRGPPSDKPKRTRDEKKENEEPPPNKSSKKRKLFKNSDIEVTEEEETYKTDIKSLQEECVKDKPSKAFVKTLMSDTLAIWHNWISKEDPTVDFSSPSQCL